MHVNRHAPAMSFDEAGLAVLNGYTLVVATELDSHADAMARPAPHTVPTPRSVQRALLKQRRLNTGHGKGAFRAAS